MRNEGHFEKPLSASGSAAAPATAKQHSAQEMRKARVSELREQFASGRYLVDPAELARKIIQAHFKK